MASQTESFVADREGEFWVNAAIGAVVAVVLSFIPLSPVLGGGVAAYLQTGTRTAGAKVGAASGLVAALPVFAVFTLLFGGLGLGVLFEGSALGLVFFLGLLLVGVVVTAVLAAGMGALGGYLGIALRERSADSDPVDYVGTDSDAVDPADAVADPAVDADSETVR